MVANVRMGVPLSFGSTTGFPNPQAVLDALHVPIWIYDFDAHRIAWANRAAASFWEAPDPESLVARPLGELSPAVRTRLEGYRRRLRANETLDELWTLYPNGQPRTTRCRCTAFALGPDREGMLVEGTPTAADADLVRNVEAVRHASVGVSWVDADGRVLVRNPAGQRTFGEAGAAFADAFLEPGAGEALLAQTRAAGSCETEAWMRTVDGEAFHALHALRTKDPATGAEVLLVYQYDRTARHRLLEQQRRHDALIRSVTALVPNAAVGIFDADLRVLFAGGPKLEELIGPGARLEGRRLEEVLPRDADPEEYVSACRAALDGVETSREVLLGGRTYERFTLPVRDEHGATVACMGLVYDVTERKAEVDRVRTAHDALEQKARALHEASTLDALTGLYNRRGLLGLAEDWVATAARENTDLVFLFVDIDGMKAINDAFGHEQGDEALVACARLLRSTFREQDIIARLGGDEFVVVTNDVADPARLVERLLSALARHNAEPGPFTLAMSVGTSRYDPASPRTVHAILADADARMYEAKRGARAARRDHHLSVGRERPRAVYRRRMEESDFEGTLVLEQLAAIGLVEEFFDAVDADDVERAAWLMKKANIDSSTIAVVLEKIEASDGEH
jgi:rsbT co-antagonist protein RsbR